MTSPIEVGSPNPYTSLPAREARKYPPHILGHTFEQTRSYVARNYPDQEYVFIPTADEHLQDLFGDRETAQERYDSLAELVASYRLDVAPDDEQIDSGFPMKAMARAYAYKLLAPDVTGYDRLEWRLGQDTELASLFGFDPTSIPDHTTFSTQWWERYSEEFRPHLKIEATQMAVEARYSGFEISEQAAELIRRFGHDQDEDVQTIPDDRQIENNRRDQVFNEFQHLFDDVLDYDRAENASVEAETLTELATFISRRNESTRGGRDVYVKENEDVSDPDFISEETLASPIRDLSREIAERRYSSLQASVPGEECYDWSVNPEDRDFEEGKSWHNRTEKGIGEQVDMMQSRGMLDRPVDICIDGVAREYNNRNDTDVEEPDGVLHRYPKYETGYAYQDITLTAIYRGRAIVLANISKVKDDNRFQCVRYLLDRARDLVNIRAVYADSEFATNKICSYITHCNLDYVMKKRKHGKEIGNFLEEGADGRADWKDYELEGKDHRKHKTTLVALEKKSKAVTKKGEQRKKSDADGSTQATFSEFVATTNSERVDETGGDESDEIERESFITSFDIDARGINPKAIGPRRDEHTAFGVGQLYRKRWSIETAFRDIKQNFKAKPRSRCLGVRRFFFMLCLLLYNCWVLLNLIVANDVDHRADDEIVWRKKTFVIDFYNDVFSDREFG